MKNDFVIGCGSKSKHYSRPFLAAQNEYCIKKKDGLIWMRGGEMNRFGHSNRREGRMEQKRWQLFGYRIEKQCHRTNFGWAKILIINWQSLGNGPGLGLARIRPIQCNFHCAKFPPRKWQSPEGPKQRRTFQGQMNADWYENKTTLGILMWLRNVQLCQGWSLMNGNEQLDRVGDWLKQEKVMETWQRVSKGPT